MGTILVLLMAVFCYLSGKNYQERKWNIFILTIAVSTFINVGTAFTAYIIFTYSMVLQIIYLCIDLLHGKIIRLRINRKDFYSFLFFIGSIAVGFAMLIIGVHNYLDIIPFSVSMDEVYMKTSSASKPVFGYSNISAFVILLIFCLFVFFSREFFVDDERIQKTRKSFIYIFRAYFVCVIGEFILNNLVSPNLVRNVVMMIFGQSERGYAFSQQRNGLYSVNSLFSEPSYIIVSLFYYMLILRKQQKSNVDILWNFVGIVALLLSGASTGLLLVPFAVISTIWSGKKPSLRIKIDLKKCFFLFAIGMATVSIIYNQKEVLLLILDSVVQKLLAYIYKSVTNDYISGSIRQFGNSVVYAAFIDMPLWGYGLGTTRGYGIIPGALGTLGIIGCGAYCNFMKRACAIKIDFIGWIILVIFIAYTSSVLSVWYLYEPAILLLCFSITCKGNKGTANIEGNDL